MAEAIPVKSRALIGWNVSRDGPNFPGNGPVRITGFTSPFVYQGTTKGNFEKPPKSNEFSKLITKSCRTMNNLKESFTIDDWKWRFYVTLYVCAVCCLKKCYIINFLLTESAVVMGKYQRARSVHKRPRSDILPWRQHSRLIIS